MHPVVTTIELFGVSRPIGGYGLMMALALLCFGGLYLLSARRHRLDPGAVVAVLAVTVVGASAGGYLLSAVVLAIQTGRSVEAFTSAALTFYGGLAGGVFAMTRAAQHLRLPPAMLLDMGVPAVALAHALGRVGCFLGGCCYGARHEGTFAVTYIHRLAPAGDRLARHPVQLYEAGGLVLLALLFARVPVGRRPPGARFCMYLAAYAILRFALEFLRGDAVRGLWLAGLLSTSQVISVGLLVVLIGVGRRWVGMSLHRNWLAN